MSAEPLSASELEALAAFDTPTICNALEVIAPHRRAMGFTTQTFVCPFPQLKPMVGYARTVLIRAMEPTRLSGPEQRKLRLDYYRYVAEGPGPQIAVLQDVDSRAGFGCFWGEVQTAIHKALGCQGLITDGGVRDLDAIAPGFQVLCGKVTPSHAWVRAIAMGCEVDVFGMVVHSGDLIHEDRHGAVVIPPEVARQVADAAVLCGRREEPILKVARSKDFTLDKLAAAMAEAAEIH
jgi:regulator of RNase E activity RraA